MGADTPPANLEGMNYEQIERPGVPAMERGYDSSLVMRHASRRRSLPPATTIRARLPAVPPCPARHAMRHV